MATFKIVDLKKMATDGEHVTKVGFKLTLSCVGKANKTFYHELERAVSPIETVDGISEPVGLTQQMIDDLCQTLAEEYASAEAYVEPHL